MGKFPKDAPFKHNYTCSTMVTMTLFMITRNSKQLSCFSIEEFMKKMWYICMWYNRDLLSCSKKSDDMKFTGKWMWLGKKNSEWGNPLTERKIYVNGILLVGMHWSFLVWEINFMGRMRMDPEGGTKRRNELEWETEERKEVELGRHLGSGVETECVKNVFFF